MGARPVRIDDETLRLLRGRKPFESMSDNGLIRRARRQYDPAKDLNSHDEVYL